jgi:hypothetical protein
VIESIFGLFKVTRAAYDATSKFLHLQLRGQGSEGDDETAEAVDTGTLLQQFGVAVKPVVTRQLRVLAIRWGRQIWPLKIWDKTKLPTDLEEGETRVFSVGNINVRISAKSSGGTNSIEITADGGDVIVNGGELKVARVTDPVNVGTLMGQAGPYPVIFTFTGFDAEGAPVAGISAGSTVTLSAVVSTDGGAEHHKS